MYFHIDLRALERVLRSGREIISLDIILSTTSTTLKQLSKSAYMRAIKAGFSVEHVDYATVLRMKGMVCGICNMPIIRTVTRKKGGLTFDHIIPLSHGGTHLPENIQPAHVECVRLKNEKRQEGEENASTLTVSNLESLSKTNLQPYGKHTISEI